MKLSQFFKINSMTLVWLLLLISLSANLYAQDNIQKDIDKVKVGILIIESDSDIVNKTSLAVKYIIEHYFKELQSNAVLVDVDYQKKDINNFENLGTDVAVIDLAEKIISNNTCDALLIIASSSTLGNMMSNVLVVRPGSTGNLGVVYKNIFPVDIDYLDQSIPPKDLLLEMPAIIDSITSFVVVIATNAPKAEIYINDTFISYAEPSVILTANTGIYNIKISADGYETLTTELIVDSNLDVVYELKRQLYLKSGLSILGMFGLFEDMFPADTEYLRITTLYSFQYFFPIAGHNRFSFDFNLIILNLTRVNSAVFSGDEFEAEIDINSISFFGNFSYEPVFKSFPWLSPRITMGVGWVSNTTLPRTTKSPSIAFSVGVGIAVRISRRFSIILDYRYLWLGSVLLIELTEIYPETGIVLNIKERLLTGSILFLGLRYNL